MSNYNTQLQSNNTDLQTVLQTLQTKAAGGSADAVLFTAQDLTEEQKAQARKNIGVVDGDARTDTFKSGDTATVVSVSSLIIQGKTVEKPGKNLCSLGSAEFTQQGDYDIAEIPAGIYSLSLKVESSDTDSDLCVLAFLNASGETVSSRALGRDANDRISVSGISLPEAITKLRLFASNNWPNGTGDTATFTDIQIEAGTTVTDYEPYGIVTTGIRAEISFGDEVFSSDTILFDGDTLDFAKSILRRADGTSSVIAVSGNVSALNGKYKITAPNKVIVTHKYLSYVLFEPQVLDAEQQAQTRKNIGAASQDEMDSLGLTPIVSKNLFNVAAVTTQAWAAYNTGKLESYPDNPYIQGYSRSEFISVTGGACYTFSDERTRLEGRQWVSSHVWYDAEKKYISGQNIGAWTPVPYVLTAPANAAYIIINFQTTDYTLQVQLEKGEAPTAYAPYGLVGSMIAEAKLPLGNILYTDGILQLPKQYNLVVGDTFELFYKGVMLCKDPYAYNIQVTCAVGKAYSRKYVFTPTEVGSHTLEIKVTDDFGNVLGVQSAQLVVSAKMASPASNINVLCFGDSLTAGGNWVDEVYRRLTKTTSVTQHNATAPVGDGLSNITFVGKKTTQNGAGYEGTGGWRYSDYLDASMAGNPFAYNGNVDFTAYCSALGINKIDQCYILLGWNMSWMTESAWKADATALISKLIAHNSAIKIVLMGLQIPAYDGLAENYGANGGLANYRALQEYVFRVDQWNKDIAADYPNNVSSISIAGQFDTENNMPTANTTPNIRNATQIKQQSNGVHPDNPGYYQIADAAYRKFTADNA